MRKSLDVELRVTLSKFKELKGQWPQPRKRISIYLITAVLSFAFSACGRDDGVGECIPCDNGGGAVRCYLGLFGHQDICAPDANIAAYQCEQGGGTWALLPLCPPDGETGYDPGPDPWDPGSNVTLDPSVGAYVIQQLAFEELKLDPSPLLGDTSGLRQLDSGYYEVAHTGALSDALGWRVGDVLLRVDGYRLQGLHEVSVAYTNLANNTEFVLTIRRGRDEVVLRYRVE